MHRVKIELTTMSDVVAFVEKVKRINGAVTVIDGTGLRVNAKSLLGMVYALEFTSLWCESDEDIYTEIQQFAI